MYQLSEWGITTLHKIWLDLYREIPKELSPSRVLTGTTDQMDSIVLFARDRMEKDAKRIVELEGDKDILEEQVSDLETKKEELDNKVYDLERDLKDRNEKIDDLKSQIDELNSKLEAAEGSQ